MKFSRSPLWAMSLLAALALAPLGASAQSNQAAPVARTKPVIDHAPTHKSHVGAHGATREQQQHTKAHHHVTAHEAAPKQAP